jgi:uncharacterized membrane protein
VVIELSASQVEKIVRGTSPSGGMSRLFSGLADVRAILAAEPEELENGRLSRGLLRGLLILAALQEKGGYVALSELARMCDLSPSTTHRFVSTLLAVGLVERDPLTPHYGLVDAG